MEMYLTNLSRYVVIRTGCVYELVRLSQFGRPVPVLIQVISTVSDFEKFCDELKKKWGIIPEWKKGMDKIKFRKWLKSKGFQWFD